jgi:hypothetical protein
MHEPDCAANYDLNEPIYVCRACGGLLDIERTQPPDRRRSNCRPLATATDFGGTVIGVAFGVFERFCHLFPMSIPFL